MSSLGRTSAAPRRYQELIRHERAIQNATVTPMNLPAGEFMDAQIAARASALLEVIAKGGKEEGAKESATVSGHFARFSDGAGIKARAQEAGKRGTKEGAGGSVLDERPPFMLMVGFHLPHEPYLFPSSAWDQYEDAEKLLPLLRGRRATRPYGMPPFALGDVQAPFSYFDKYPGRGRGESHGRTYGPHLSWEPELDPVAIANHHHHHHHHHHLLDLT